MCVLRNHVIFCDDPSLFPGGKDFGDVSRQNVIMILYLSKLHAVVHSVGKWTLLRGKCCYVLYLRLVSFR